MSPQDPSQIVFFRPSAVGDFVFALPCLAALKARYPAARLVYVGQRWHAEFLPDRVRSVDEVLVLPDCAGINADNSDQPALEAFLGQIRQRRVALAIQAFGGGKRSNPLVRSFGACRCVGFRAANAPPLDQTLPYSDLQNRRLQLLELAELAGAPAISLQAGLVLTDADQRETERILPYSRQPLAVIQPGASDPRRRWAAQKFACVADVLADSGMRIAVNGTDQERDIVQSVIASMSHEAIDLSGRLSLGGLCALLSRSVLLVSNDTGPLHLATAIGTPSVGIYWLTNLLESCPLQQNRHRAAWATATACPVCGISNLRQRCVHQASFVDEIGVEDVLALVRELVTTRP